MWHLICFEGQAEPHVLLHLTHICVLLEMIRVAIARWAAASQELSTHPDLEHRVLDISCPSLITTTLRFWTHDCHVKQVAPVFYFDGNAALYTVYVTYTHVSLHLACLSGQDPTRMSSRLRQFRRARAIQATMPMP